MSQESSYQESSFSYLSDSSNNEEAILTDIPYISWDMFERDIPIPMELDYIFEDERVYIRTSSTDADVLLGISWDQFMSGRYGWIDVRVLYF